jgi:hypothetical protein
MLARVVGRYFRGCFVFDYRGVDYRGVDDCGSGLHLCGSTARASRFLRRFVGRRNLAAAGGKLPHGNPRRSKTLDDVLVTG